MHPCLGIGKSSRIVITQTTGIEHSGIEKFGREGEL